MGNYTDIEDLRKKYALIELSEDSVSKDPIEQFEIWFKDVIESSIVEPSAMVLATANKEGIPTLRTVLLKSFDSRGFVFFTNYESRKAKDLLDNPNVSVLFLWKEVERQVRISGSIAKITTKESEEYFRSRPIESQLGAWASKQSTIIPSREYLVDKYEKYRAQFEGKEVPLPSFWGGYRIIPTEFEFWQGRENRLHDRICYEIKGKGWHIYRLSP